MPKSMTMASAGAIRDEYSSDGYWAMGLAPYHLIRITIEMAIEVGAFFSVIDFLSCINVVNSLTPPT
jgi:hypothetical protein